MAKIGLRAPRRNPDSASMSLETQWLGKEVTVELLLLECSELHDLVTFNDTVIHPSTPSGAIGAQTIWGFFPIYINQFKGVIEPLEIVGHRAIWSFALLLGLFAIVRLRSPKPLPEATRLSTSNSNSQRSTPKNDANPYASPASTTEEPLPAITRESDSDSKTKRSRLIGMGLIAAVLIAVNWLTYVWAVNNGRILDASLGYYICPQVIVLIGVFVLGERLGKVQWLAVAFASIGVLVMTQSAASTPWVGICLAVVWGLYGLVKKKTSLSATNGLMLETGILLVPALAMLTWQATHGQPIFGDSLWVNSLLVLSGAATVTPLALYAIALKHLRFSTIGLLQFLGPTIQFLLGAFESGEPLDQNRIVGFVFVWLGVVMFLVSLYLTRSEKAKTKG